MIAITTSSSISVNPRRAGAEGATRAPRTKRFIPFLRVTRKTRKLGSADLAAGMKVCRSLKIVNSACRSGRSDATENSIFHRLDPNMAKEQIGNQTRVGDFKESPTHVRQVRGLGSYCGAGSGGGDAVLAVSSSFGASVSVDGGVGAPAPPPHPTTNPSSISKHRVIRIGDFPFVVVGLHLPIARMQSRVSYSRQNSPITLLSAMAARFMNV